MKVWLPTIKAGSGADVFIKRLAVALTREGLEVKITWFNKRYEFAPFLLKNIPPPVGTDIVFANSWNGFAFKRQGIPLVIVELHCVFDAAFVAYKSFGQTLYHSLVIKRYETLSFGRASHVVAISEYTAKSLQTIFNLQNVSVIPLWVPMDKFQQTVTNTSEPEQPFRLLFVGNLINRKGGDLLEPIMAQLGDGFQLRFTAGLRTSSKNEGYPMNMTPLGHLSEAELIYEYQKCDALLFPSRFEGFGYVVLEAMACGKPVVTSNNTSLPELVCDGENGILCATEDIDSFVTASRTLAENRSMAREMGEKGISKARLEFSEKYNASQYASMLESVLAGTSN